MASILEIGGERRIFPSDRKAAQPMPDTHDAEKTREEMLATPRKPAAGEVLRAHPVKGKVDHAALTREIIARYPKILAALAK